MLKAAAVLPSRRISQAHDAGVPPSSVRLPSDDPLDIPEPAGPGGSDSGSVHDENNEVSR